MAEDSQLYKFVKSLFLGQGKELADGAISIEMIGNPRFLVVRLYEDKDKSIIEVKINKDKLGYFERYEGQGLTYAFHQYRRTGMNKKTLTSAEKFLEDTCDYYRDEIRLFRAYH